MNLLKQYIVIILAVLMTACGDGGDSSPPASSDAVWDSTNWDEKNWQ